MYSPRILNLFALSLALDISGKGIKRFKERVAALQLTWSWITHLRWGFYFIVCGKDRVYHLAWQSVKRGEKKLRPAKSLLICKPSEKDYLFGNVCWQTFLRIMIKILNFKHMSPDKSDEIPICVKFLYWACFIPSDICPWECKWLRRKKVVYWTYINSGVQGNVCSERKLMQGSVKATRQGIWDMCIESHGKMQAAVGICKAKGRRGMRFRAILRK